MLLRTPEDVPADEGAAEFQEHLANVGATIEANAKAAGIVEPRVRTFDHPTILAEVAVMFGTMLRDYRPDAALAQRAGCRVES